MARAPRMFRSLIMLSGAAVLLAGCGAAAPPAVPVTPAPSPTAGGSTVANGGAPAPTGPAATAAPAVDPVTGQPIDATGLSAAATVPNLSGGDISGGLASVNTKDVFAAGAVSADQAAQAATTDTTATTATTDATTATTQAASYNGAVIYVNGKTYTVATNGTFPTGSPVFRLVDVAPGSIEISLLAGEFTGDHSDGLFLDKGDLKSLVDASANITYKVKYLRATTDVSAGGF
jgi:hypothetical protein